MYVEMVFQCILTADHGKKWKKNITYVNHFPKRNCVKVFKEKNLSKFILFGKKKGLNMDGASTLEINGLSLATASHMSAR